MRFVNSRTIIISMALVAGCSGAELAETTPAVPPPPAQSVVGLTETAPAASPEAARPVEAYPAPLVPAGMPAVVARPENVSCRIDGTSWEKSITSPRFQLTLDGSAWGDWVDDDAPTSGSVTLLTGSHTKMAFVAWRHPKISLEGWMDTAALHLFPSRAVYIGGVLIPKYQTTLRWWKGRKGTLSVSQSPGQPVVSPDAIAGELPCDAFRAVPQPFDALAELKIPDDAKRMMVTDESVLGFKVKPGLPVAAKLKSTKEAPLYLTIVERAEGHARVVTELREYFVVGWIPEASVGQLANGGVGYGGSRGDRGRLGFRLRKAEHPLVRCDAAIPFAAKVGEVTRTVGQLQAGVVIEVFPTGDVMRRIAPRGLPLRTLKGTELFAATVQLAGCRAHEPTPPP
jgi:hypothetical protein